jgi:hypothetical protein
MAGLLEDQNRLASLVRPESRTPENLTQLFRTATEAADRLSAAAPHELKRLLGLWVLIIRLTPDRLAITLNGAAILGEHKSLSAPQQLDDRHDPDAIHKA